MLMFNCRWFNKYRSYTKKVYKRLTLTLSKVCTIDHSYRSTRLRPSFKSYLERRNNYQNRTQILQVIIKANIQRKLFRNCPPLISNICNFQLKTQIQQNNNRAQNIFSLFSKSMKSINQSMSPLVIMKYKPKTQNCKNYIFSPKDSGKRIFRLRKVLLRFIMGVRMLTRNLLHRISENKS